MRLVRTALFAAFVACSPLPLAAQNALAAPGSDATDGRTALTIPAHSTVSYPNVSIHNFAPFGLQIWLNYTLHSCDVKWMHATAAVTDSGGRTTPGSIDPHTVGGKNLCLIYHIKVQADKGAPAGLQIQDYYSNSGTSYRNYYFLPATAEQEYTSAGTLSWQLFSEAEANIPNQSTSGKSPGFVVTNSTKWPVAVSFDQAGCLYHDVIRPGQSMNRSTGAVWFTMRASIVPDGKDPNTDLSCSIPVVEIVADVLEAAMTAGAFSWAELSAEAVKDAVGPLAAKLIPGTVIRGAATAAGKDIFEGLVKTLAQQLSANQNFTKMGQYAGPPWPFRCATKPTYDITGGWGATGYHGDTLWIDPGSPLTVKKTNTCGNSMMRGSVP